MIDQTRTNVAESRVDSAEAVRLLGAPLVAFSMGMAEDLGRLRLFLHQRMYRHYRVNRMRSQARRILADMFGLFFAEPEVLPTEWFERIGGLEDGERARLVCDYIAGMTDRFAVEEHRRLFTLDLGL